MPTIARFEEIEAWKTARVLTRCLYTHTNQGAWSRDYGLRDQIRRSSVSIMSNVAEGFESGSDAQFHRCLAIAKGSAGEVRAQLYVALDAGYLDDADFPEIIDLADKCSRQLSRLMTYLRTTVSGHRIGEDVPPYDDDALVDSV